MRDVAEHNAMFTNYDGVRQVRDARQNKYEMSNEDFGSFIQSAFGRSLPQDNATKDFTEVDAAGGNLGSYLDLELDEINFTPFED